LSSLHACPPERVWTSYDTSATQQ